MKIYEDNHAKMDYDEDGECLWLTWLGKLEKEESEEIYGKALEYLSYYHLRKILVDNESESPSRARVMEWFDQMALTEFVNNGVEAVALVNPGDEERELRKVLNRIVDDVVIRSFSDASEAEMWLESRYRFTGF